MLSGSSPDLGLVRRTWVWLVTNVGHAHVYACRYIEDRYKQYDERGDDDAAGDAGTVGQQGLLPSINDPKLWMVQVGRISATLQSGRCHRFAWERGSRCVGWKPGLAWA